MQATQLHTAEGGQHIDTASGCSTCKGDCPCPQACERREEARQAQSARGLLPLAWAVITQRLAPRGRT